MELRLKNHSLDFSKKTCVMGILNVTPDSFWDGGKHQAAPAAVARAKEMVAEGADVIDVGAESTRPGGAQVDEREEIARLRPVLEAVVRDLSVPISIDTRKARVAREMLSLGAHMINDVSGLTFDPAMVDVVREFDVPVVIMHMRGVPENMQLFTTYGDVVADVGRELGERIGFALARGIRPENIVIDPGIGFAKTAEQNLELIARLDELTEMGKPILVGPSMKSFMGKTLGLEPYERGEATIACCIVAAANGASMVRVHDVAGVSKALAMFDQLKEVRQSEAGRVS